ncbi:hypothetical protein MYAM1_003518 [Malassezia yamatoensis]|uniref:non-specific serine/threonine protein kinase n=1 Tax=Malassezia yamatoensis TaxID=253288 RepID=A0AAJ6CIZ1_9BASI|nr:hypothetical protein MYAM1_003518 [Malassezia yamatoensis]
MPETSGSCRAPSASAYVLEGYESLDVIGSGTFGVIRKVRRKTDGALFARKELHFERMSERDRKHIVSEVNILRTLRHENVVRYEERYVDTENGILYIVMELCEGGDLGSIIKRCRRTRTHLPEDTVWAYFAQMTAALEACHYRTSPNTAVGTTRSSLHAILHRDLKPENVFLDQDQNVKLGDFGLSKQIAAQAFANTYVGTPYYMSPELASGHQYDIKSDIWALGCIVYELCALSPPFDAANQAELTRKIKQGVVPCLPRNYSRELQDTVNAMLQLDPRRRPTTRQLLNVRQVKWACRMHELAQLHRKIQLEKQQVDARDSVLRLREEALEKREASADTMASVQDVEKRERELEKRQVALQQHEETYKKMHAELQQQYEAWQNNERGKVYKMLAEKEARISALENQLQLRDSTQFTRRVSEPIPVGARLAAKASPRILNRVSGRNREMDQILRTKIAEGALSLGTPHKPSTHPEPSASEDWEDQELDEAQSDSYQPPVQQKEFLTNQDPPRSSQASQDASENTNHSPSLQPAIPAIAHLRRLDLRSDLSDCSMKDASTIWRRATDPDTSKLATPHVSAELSVLATPPKSLKTKSAPQELLPESGAQGPQWHLMDEQDRPSPFLKRVTRLPLDTRTDSVPDQEPEVGNALLVPGPMKVRKPLARRTSSSTVQDQENTHTLQRQRSALLAQRKRRSSLLRPPDTNATGTRAEPGRMPIARAPMPASPAGRIGPLGRMPNTARGSPRHPRIRRPACPS